jgi:acyl carrier protein
MAGSPREGFMTDGKSQARAMLADAIGSDPAQVPETARIGLFERWDSLAHLRLLLAIEQRIGRPLEPDEAVAIESLDDVARLLDAAQNPG